MSPEPIMDISCVLLTWNSARYIEPCLHSLLTELEAHAYTHEIFIVDNGSSDATVSLLKSFQNKYPEHIFPIFLETNTGTTYSRNLGLKRASGQYFAIMDSDIEITPGVFPQLLHTLEEHEQTGLVAPRLLYPSGHLQKSTDGFPTVLTKILRYFFLKAVEKRDHEAETTQAQHPQPREVDYAISAMWVLKRNVLETVGLLDEHIFYAPEDVDYCLRIWKAGYSILYEPRVSCIHHTQEITRGFKMTRATLSHVYGLFYYFLKHRYVFRRPQRRRP